MSLEGHLFELERRHESIEREIKTHLTKPYINSEQIAELKRRKLQLKDEITRIYSRKDGQKLN
ncbi:hypothetical protein FHS82_000707 [Pseudochelatococcus lubricantis]|uniref:DUF465 domain-containing protein n=1 Tax=Pseudochelatococcus lubricantis TaxID=1538102 RepID=A0ABX0UX92_9HYPH|nr:DUF465 domain-containing protein [Pseudochelatococcus lubricantis]NIJ56894.1 hypothetical protein [Pseudochelatococcus lubricantis]